MFPAKRRTADRAASGGPSSLWLWLGGAWLLLLVGSILVFSPLTSLVLLPFAAVVGYRITRRDNTLARNWLLGCLAIGLFFAFQSVWGLLQEPGWQTGDLLAEAWWGSFVFWGFHITVFMGSLTVVTSLVRRLRAAREK